MGRPRPADAPPPPVLDELGDAHLDAVGRAQARLGHGLLGRAEGDERTALQQCRTVGDQDGERSPPGLTVNRCETFERVSSL